METACAVTLLTVDFAQRVGAMLEVPGEFSVTRSTLVSADFGGSGNLNVLAEILVLFLAGLRLSFAQKDGNQKK